MMCMNVMWGLSSLRLHVCNREQVVEYFNVRVQVFGFLVPCFDKLYLLTVSQVLRACPFYEIPSGGFLVIKYI